MKPMIEISKNLNLQLGGLEQIFEDQTELFIFLLISDQNRNRPHFCSLGLSSQWIKYPAQWAQGGHGWMDGWIYLLIF